MTLLSRDRRKIDPSKGATLPDGTPNDEDRIEIGPTHVALAEWEAAGLVLPDLAAMRAFRLSRLTGALAARDYGGVLFFDPLNIRYATDTTNMQIWNMHNPFRACLVCADGYMVLWEYKNAPFLADHNPLVREVRSGASMFYFAAGDRGPDAARAFAAQVAEVMSAHAGTNKRLAVDKILVHGLHALVAAGFDVEEGEELAEHARSIKGPEEIRAMRCAVYACEASMHDMEAAVVPGMTEDEIWGLLNYHSHRRGGEWVETRLLTSGPRTNPWFQECGPRRLKNNEILAFDTDLVGCYGICTDISRTWWIGDRPPRQDMIDTYRHALDHITENAAMLRPGVTIEALVHNGHRLWPHLQRQKYSCKFHGVGLCDEWPHVDYPETYIPGAWDHALQPGMTLCVEVLASPEGGDFSIKLEDQVLITETGHERLSAYPYDPWLLGTRTA